MTTNNQSETPGLTSAELSSEGAFELPTREALTLIDPGLVSGTGAGALPGTEQAPSDTTGMADGTSSRASQLASQSTADASDLGSQATADATSPHASSGPYQPVATSEARS